MGTHKEKYDLACGIHLDLITRAEVSIDLLGDETAAKRTHHIAHEASQIVNGNLHEDDQQIVIERWKSRWEKTKTQWLWRSIVGCKMT